MPPDSRQVDVQQERGERNPAPTRGATPQELATAAGAGDVKLTETKLLPDEEELRRIIDLIPQTIVVLSRDGNAIFANRVALEYTIPSRVHDPRRPGDLLKVGGDPLDDAIDAARYGLYSWVTASEKPLELRMREAVQGLDTQSAYIRSLQMKAEAEFKGSPARIGRRELWNRRGMWR